MHLAWVFMSGLLTLLLFSLHSKGTYVVLRLGEGASVCLHGKQQAKSWAAVNAHLLSAAWDIRQAVL